MAYYNFVHSIGLHSWDIPALVVLLLIIIVGLVHWRNQKKRQDDFEEELKTKLNENGSGLEGGASGENI